MGLHNDACADNVASGLAPFFQVRKVDMVREGDPESPWAIVEVDNSY